MVSDFKFRVLEYRPNQRPGILRAHVTFEDETSGLQFVDCGYFKRDGENGAAWISPPARALPLPAGAPTGTKPEYRPLLTFASAATRKSWQTAAMVALDAHMVPGSQQKAEEQDPWLYDDLPFDGGRT